jgi:hypothetical protein
LTVALMSAGVWVLFRRSAVWKVGLVAGLLMINKLDLVPVGMLLILARWVQMKRCPVQAISITVALACAWYSFAWWYFGAPVPNSFLTKSLHQGALPHIIDWTWFGTFLFLNGLHRWLTILATLAIWFRFRKVLPILVFLVGTIAVHLFAYTLKYQFEPYNR